MSDQEAGLDEAEMRQCLEALVIDNEELEQLEALLAQFNIFEAIGAVRQEVRHSDFLAFLLDPQQSHGLGDIFVKKLLQKAVGSTGDAALPVRPIDLELWSLDDIEVRREWQNIDILLLSEAHRLAVIIENKVDSGEHSGQLGRYRQTVSQHYPDPEWRVIGLFLTPEGEQPSDERYMPISYTLVCELVESLIEARASTLGPEVRTLMGHYAQMLRRHIVSESEIADLCQRIYRKHKQALDLIFEYRPDLQSEISNLLERLVGETDGLIMDHSSKSYPKFAVREWDVPALMEGSGWTRSGRMLLFQFENLPKSLRLKLIIGPGPDQTRRLLYELARKDTEVLRGGRAHFGVKYHTMFTRPFLATRDYEDASIEEIESRIRERWKQFLEGDLLRIKKVLSAGIPASQT